VYNWEYFSADAEEQVEALPIEAVAPLLELLAVLAFDPWEYGRPPGEAVDKGKSLRTLPFGPGAEGLLTFQIYDPDRRVLIAKVLWLG
jgi:hypothetical protein